MFSHNVYHLKLPIACRVFGNLEDKEFLSASDSDIEFHRPCVDPIWPYVFQVHGENDSKIPE